MWKIYVGNLDSGIRERELADAFRTYGDVRSVWVARNPPGYAFVELDNRRDAEDAIAALDGRRGWRVEMSKKSIGYSEPRCFQCGSSRHFARDCRYRSSRRSSRRSPSPYSRRDGPRGSLSRIERGGNLSPRYDRRGSPRYSPMGRGRNYERTSGSDRSESRSSYRRRRERSISPVDTKINVKSSERGPELSRSPQSIRSDLEGSLEMRERSRSPPAHLRSSPDGSPVRNGIVYSNSPTGKDDLDMEDDRIRAAENNREADPSASPAN